MGEGGRSHRVVWGEGWVPLYKSVGSLIQHSGQGLFCLFVLIWATGGKF